MTIKYKDYTRKIRTTETMTGEEFVRRFMLHIVPRGVHRVRYGGIFHGKGRKPRLDQCRQLLIEYNEKSDIHYYSSVERNLPKCARCKTPEMSSLGFQDARTTRAIIAIT